MQSFSIVASVIAFLTIWYTLTKVDMRPETAVRNQAQYSAPRKNPPRNNTGYNGNRSAKTSNHHGQGYQSSQPSYANQQQFGQQSYGTVSQGSGYQQTYNGQTYNNNGGNTSWTGNVNGYVAPQQVQYSNGYQAPAPAPSQPLVQGYAAPQYPTANMSYNQNYVPQQGPAPQMMDQQYIPQFPMQQQPLMQGPMPPPMHGQMQMIPQQNGIPHDQQFVPQQYPLPPPGQQLQMMPLPQQFQQPPPQQPSYPMPDPNMHQFQNFSQHPGMVQQQFPQPMVYGNEGLPYSPQNYVEKTPLFVNHQLIPPGSSFTNADGYTEQYNGMASHQPIVYDSFEGIRKSRQSGEDESMLAEVQKTIDNEQEQQEFPEAPAPVAPVCQEPPQVAQESVTTAVPSESVAAPVEAPEEVVDVPPPAPQTENQPLPASLDHFMFIGNNFPSISKEQVSPDAVEAYNELLSHVTNLIKDFYTNKVEQWNQLDVKSRFTGDYAFVNEPLTPDEGYGFSSETVTPATDIRTDSPESNATAASNLPDNEEMVTIDYFIPAQPLKVPRSYLRAADNNPESNCLMLEGGQSDFVEKKIDGKALKDVLDSEFLPIEFTRSEKQRIFDLLQSGQEATVVFYAELPDTPSGSQGTPDQRDSPDQPGSPVQELPVAANSPGETSSEETDSSATHSASSPSSSENSDGQAEPAPQNQSPRFSRINGYTDPNGTPNRGRSASNFGASSFARSSRPYPWDPTLYPTAAAFAANGGAHPRPKGSRQLPAIPPQYLNGQGTSASFNRSWPPAAQGVPRAESVDAPSLARRRHQSQDAANRAQSGQYPQPWMNEHPHLRFIVPTERELMARVPFPPFRIPLIGVARREPGQPYVPQRILPAHENYEIFRLRMRELQDSAMPSRGDGALLLEPRGFLDSRGRAREFGAGTSQQGSSGAQGTSNPHQGAAQHDTQEFVDQCEFRNTFLLEQEEARKRRETASTCRNMSPYLRYHHDSTDDDDEAGPSCSNAGASASRDQAPSSSAITTSSPPSHSNAGQGSSSSSSKNRRSEPKQRPVKDTASKNQKRRERDQRRLLRKEEEKIREIELQREAIIERERLAAEQRALAEQQRLEQQDQAMRRAAKEKLRRAEMEKQRVLEEERRIKAEQEKAEKRKMMNQLNKEKKKMAKQNKYAAMMKAKEEEEKQQQMVRSLMQTDIQQSFNLAILSKLADAKKKLDQNVLERASTSENITRYLKQSPKKTAEDQRMLELIEPVILELENSEEVDTRTIAERSKEIAWFFNNDVSFQCDIEEQKKSSQDGRFKMTVGICKMREAEAIKKYAATQHLIHAKAVRQYRYWIQNMYDDLSFFVNFVVGLCDLTEDDPTMEKFEEWAIYDNEKYNIVTTFETNV